MQRSGRLGDCVATGCLHGLERRRAKGIIAMEYGVILLIAIVSYSASQHRLDSKAAKLQHGNDEERQLAGELRDISRQIDQGKYFYR